MADPDRTLTPQAAAALRARFLRGFPAIGLAIFLSAVDQTVTATALPAIAAELGTLERVAWIVVVYLVAATCAAPVFGQLGDVFGRRKLLFIGLGLFALGAVGCALAPDLGTLILARIVQGFGGGALYTLAQALIGEAVPPRDRGRFQAYIAGTFAAASALGPVLGGFVTEWFGWRAVFLVFVPLAILCAALALRLARVPPARRGARLRFDWAGLALFVAMVAAALVALDRLRRLDLAALPWALALLLVAGLAAWLLVRVERVARDPLLPLGMLGEPSIWRSLLLSALVAGAMVGSIAFLPIHLQAVLGLSAGAAGLALVPLSLGGGLGALFAGRMVARTGRGMDWPGYGLLLAAALMAVVALALPVLPPVALALLLGLVSVGTGTSYPVVQTTVQAAAGRERLGAASAAVAFSRSLGAAAGAAGLGAVLFGGLALAASGAGDVARLAAEGPGLLDQLQPEAAGAVRAGLGGAFRALFAVAAVLLLIAAWLAWRVPLRRF
ncbi:MAG TPA: MFS transporter [Acetobacteraceae bacterium]|nr:MFS transporter [Acetobacteraceae bacterium]